MISHTRLTQRCLVAVATSLAVSVTILGCGDDGLGKRYSVSGTVNYNGQPLEKGDIGFVPEDPGGRAAFGTIEGGSYSLSTIGERDGALPGKYKVTVTSKDVDLTAADADFKKKNPNAVPGVLPKDMLVKASKSAKSRIPKKYSTPNDSGLTAEVKEQSNSIPFDLTD